MADEAKPTTYLSLDAILGADDLEERDVEIPSWGGTVRVKALSRASVRKIYQDATHNGVVDNEHAERGLICMGMVNPVIRPDAYAKLDSKSAGAVQAIVQAIMEVTGLTPDATDKASHSFRARPDA